METGARTQRVVSTNPNHVSITVKSSSSLNLPQNGLQRTVNVSLPANHARSNSSKDDNVNADVDGNEDLKYNTQNATTTSDNRVNRRVSELWIALLVTVSDKFCSENAKYAR